MLPSSASNGIRDEKLLSGWALLQPTLTLLLVTWSFDHGGISRSVVIYLITCVSYRKLTVADHQYSNNTHTHTHTHTYDILKKWHSHVDEAVAQPRRLISQAMQDCGSVK